MRDTIKLSIGIPTYNQASTLEQSILSALNQTVPAYEVVVSNNHCTDGTEKILQKYADKIKVVSPPSFLPMSANWDFLVRQLHGDWFSIISSDDVYEPNFVETFINNVREDTVLMRFRFNLIDGDGKIIKKDVGIHSARKLQGFPGNFIEALSGSKTSFAAFALKMDAFKKIGYFDLSLERFCDWATWLKISPLGKFQYVPTTISNYRTDYREGLERKFLETETNDTLRIVQIQDEIIREYNLHPLLRNKIRCMVAKSRFDKHIKYSDDSETIPVKFGVKREDIISFSNFDRLLIQLNEALFKL